MKNSERKYREVVTGAMMFNSKELKLLYVKKAIEEVITSKRAVSYTLNKSLWVYCSSLIDQLTQLREEMQTKPDKINDLKKYLKTPLQLTIKL